MPDSLRNPKSNPQRKRPSKRCDCRWRVVLYENETNEWEFRKSLNPEAGKHNHELMRPEEIERSWPKEVTDLICELARLRMTTQDIRARVRDQFPNIHWNERRFYNRLSEERQKIKLRDSIDRTHQLGDLWSKVCMATAGNEDLFQFVKQELDMLFQSICETVQIDPHTFPAPFIYGGGSNSNNDETSENHPYNTTCERSTSGRSSSRSSVTSSATTSKSDNTPKGYICVEIPKQLYYIKIHNQRQLHETQLLKAQHRTRTFSEDQSLGEPLRKQARKGKGKQIAAFNDDSRLHSESPIQHDNLLVMNHSSPYSTSSQRTSISTASMNHSRQQQPATAFVYSYESNMALDTTLTSYVNPPFQNNYAIAANSPSTPNFNAADMSFTFDPQQHSPIGRSNTETSNTHNSSSSNEPTIHPALHSNIMPSHHHQQQQQQHRGESTTPPNTQQPQLSPQQPSSNNTNTNNTSSGTNQPMYSLAPSNSKSRGSLPPNTGATPMLSRSILSSVEQQPYHQQQQHHHHHQQQQQQDMFIRQSPPQQQQHPHQMQHPPSHRHPHPHHPSNNMLPIYQQQQQQQHAHPQSESRNSH